MNNNMSNITSHKRFSFPLSPYFLIISIICVLFLWGCDEQASPTQGTIDDLNILSQKLNPNQTIGINVLLNRAITKDIIDELGEIGRIGDIIYPINALTIKAKYSALPVIQNLPYVKAANPDVKRQGSPIDAVPAVDFTTGMNTWDLDAINVTDYDVGRTIAQTGNGVIVGVLDTGLKDSWRQYFPNERILTEYARSFGGGGMDMGTVSTQPNKWEHDNDSHGTHVTSTIIGFNLYGTYFNGTAPQANIIPVKVLGQTGWGWASVIARGIVYIAELKAGELSSYPVVINMSLGGPILDAVEQAAVDYAVAQGVIIVASAGNRGEQGMGYPGAYEPVISVASSGWIHEWEVGGWWYNLDVTDPIDPADFYICDFSSRALTGQDLDITAPGSWIVGPYQLQSGQLSYYYLGGTSMACPHVAGTVALMCEKNPTLTASEVESILEGIAIPLPGYESKDYGSGLLDALAAVTATP